MGARFGGQCVVQVDNTRQITSNLNSLRGIKNTLAYKRNQFNKEMGALRVALFKIVNFIIHREWCSEMAPSWGDHVLCHRHYQQKLNQVALALSRHSLFPSGSAGSAAAGSPSGSAGSAAAGSPSGSVVSAAAGSPSGSAVLVYHSPTVR